MVIFNCLTKGFVKIDGEFSVSTITKNVEFRQNGKECCLSENEYLALIKKGNNVDCPCETGDLIITTSTNKYIFRDVTLSIDNSLFITDEILDYMISNKDDKCVVINLDCPNENTGTEFLCKGDLIVEHI